MTEILFEACDYHRRKRMLHPDSARILLLLATAGLAYACSEPSTKPPESGVTSLTLSQTQIDLLLRDQTQLVVEARDAQGNLLSDRTPTFSSSDDGVATVDEDGWVTGVAEGTATVTATLEGMEASAAVTVAVLDFTSLSTNYFHTCALTTDGKAYCWGYNIDGQLGIGTDAPTCSLEGSEESFACQTKPVAVAGGHTFTMVTTGHDHTCALTGGGDVYCWGSNEYGALGNGTTVDNHTPVRVEAAVQFAMVACGGAHTCAVTVDGEAFCWGYNRHYELGDGTGEQRNAPVAVSGGLHFESISAGGSATCGIVTGGAGYCWGSNSYGQLGTGSPTNAITSTPDMVSGDHAFDWIGTDSYSTCAVTLAGEAYCWGRNHVGQLGDGTTTQRMEPVLVSGVLAFESLSVGSWHTCGVTDEGVLYCWGHNEQGQLGNGTILGREVPTAVPTPVSGDLTAQLVTAGSQHTCAFATTGTAYCWGESILGQLGQGSPSTNVLTPAPVIGSR